ncbi:MAG: hypothetical protein HY898_10795 [Deltaproteobacteria bacterium]|nr:hypothetical protein [Deltaproteobacteria bacterium]
MGRSRWQAGVAVIAVAWACAACGGAASGDDSSLNAGGGNGTGSTGQGGGNAGGYAGSGQGASGFNGGAAGQGASAGAGGFASPDTIIYRARKVDKLDLLFMIDNSPSMADKQEVLAAAVPDLVSHLTNPRCVDEQNGGPIQQPASPDDPCPSGSVREFDPVRDMHLGIITSSLGGHGSDTCVPASSSGKSTVADMSHLVARLDAHAPEKQAPTWDGKGFLFWDANKTGTPPGASELQPFIDTFSQIVVGAGEDGCGYEAPLEAWYRFLVDPAPYAKIVPYDCKSQQPSEGGACRGPEGVDATVLQQRADMIRADSLLAVVMLTDENDCSLVDSGQNYAVLQLMHFPRGTSACKTDPSSPACMSCADGDHASDPECAKGELPADEDSLNLRCYRQKQRFGMDLLHPLARYVNGIVKTVFSQEDVDKYNQSFKPDKDINPVYCPVYAQKQDPDHPGNTVADPSHCASLLRDPSLVMLGGIVGVPWQDIALDPQQYGSGYRPAEQLAWTAPQFQSAGLPAPGGVDDSTTLWDVIVGGVDSQHNIDYAVEPRDPLMIESVKPRSGVNPATGSALAPADAADPQANAINGHEWTTSWDLQYACVFDLPAPRECYLNQGACDCSEPSDSPLCQDKSGAHGTLQYRAKAYPGRRQLAVLKGVGDRAIVASICPANTTHGGSPDYGYRPAVGAIIDRLKERMNLACWDKPLSPAPDGTVACTVLEATRGELSGDSWVCPPCSSLAARKDASTEAWSGLQKNPNYIQNDLHCACEIPQAEAGQGLQQCVEAAEVTAGVDGWCYVDPSTNPKANPGLVLSCSPLKKRVLRFVGAGNPSQQSMVFIQCG